MTINAQMVMDLRKRTGVGMSKCKEALVESNGDIEEAIHILRKKGIASAVKKGGRETNEGMIGIASNNTAHFMVEINAETDFVIQNDRFKAFMDDICSEIAESAPKSVEDFLSQKYSKNPQLTIDEYRADIVQTLGENIQIKRIKEIKKAENGSVGLYSHMGGKIVCCVEIKGSDGVEALAKEVAMHVAAESPDYLNPEDIAQDVIDKEEEIARSQLKNKPPEIMDKIINGKLNAFYEQVCLSKQKFVKDSSITVGKYIQDQGKKIGKDLSLLNFERWQIGE